MFTGLVQFKTVISKIESSLGGSAMTLFYPLLDTFPDTRLGDSIALNGCCLTVSSMTESMLGFDVSEETLRCTNLSDLKVGSMANLEWALRMGDRLGGHLVSGHVDGLAELRSKSLTGDGGSKLQIACPKEWARHLIKKGSLCIDGISLTINELADFEGESIVDLTIIPTTMSETTLAVVEPGWRFNLEVDMMAKFVARLQTWRD